MKKVEGKMHFFKRIPYSNTLLPVRRNFNRHEGGGNPPSQSGPVEKYYLCRKGYNKDNIEECLDL
jgi:hypothetical protein